MLADLAHGWSGLALAYGAVQLPMWAGLKRAHASAQKYLVSPLIAATLTGMSALGAAATHGSLSSAAQLTFGIGLSVLFGYAGGKALAADVEPRKRHLRGSRLEPQGLEQSDTRGFDRQITVAGQRMSEQDETRHFKFIGTTGTGKSTAIEEILSGALRRGDRAVIADPDFGYLNRFYRGERGDQILNPFDARSARWDLFAEINAGYDVEQLARSLIPDHEGPDRSWRAYARTFLASVTRQARESGVCDLGELYRLLVVAEASELRVLVRGTPAQPFLDEHNSRMFDSIRSVTSASVASLEYIARQDCTALSVREWVRAGQSGVLFMPYRANQIAALGPTISAWMRLAIFETMNREEPAGREPSQRLWFVVDELDALGPIDGLKDALARLRKFGGRCVLAFQSSGLVSSAYGADAQALIENCANSLILRCSSSEQGGTAQFASRLIGEREVLRRQVSRSRDSGLSLRGGARRSRSVSHQVVIEPGVMAAEIEQLPDLAGYLKTASSPIWFRVKLN